MSLTFLLLFYFNGLPIQIFHYILLLNKYVMI